MTFTSSFEGRIDLTIYVVPSIKADVSIIILSCIGLLADTQREEENLPSDAVNLAFVGFTPPF